MLDGMGMVIKALGIDPEALQSGMKIAEEKITAIESRLASIEAKLDFIGTRIDLNYPGEETYSRKFLGEG
jgi:hypothetical protein